MTPAIYPVILSGGSGTRLWPLSRQSLPKQFQCLLSNKTLLQETALRCAGWKAPIIVCNEDHRFIIAQQLRDIGVVPHAIVIEPVGRNTAPAVAVAAELALRADPQARLLVLPSDHVIQDVGALRTAVEHAAAVPGTGPVCFGIRPDAPHTGYGYIQSDVDIMPGVARVARFVEKPAADVAARFLAAGGYLWNSGIFLFHAASYLTTLETRRPQMVAACRAALETARRDLDFIRLAAEPYAAMTGDSIDYAVMEGAVDAAVVPVDMGWSDIGSWSALHERAEQDDAGNSLSGDVLAMECEGSYLRTDQPLVVALGVKNLVVVATQDAVLVADKRHDQLVKQAVERLGADKRRQAIQSARTWRPWGWFQTIDEGSRFQVKHILVNPGSSLSLQMHHHRSEHWVVVEGVAEVTRDEETFRLNENESIFIRAGQKHRLHNPGAAPLRLIEVQSGSYLGEDDIVRFSDNYGRAD